MNDCDCRNVKCIMATVAADEWKQETKNAKIKEKEKRLNIHILYHIW